MAMYDEKGFYNWASSNPGAGEIRKYGETYGYTPAQMANIYNIGGGNAAGTSVDAATAGQWLGGVDPNKRLGNYWQNATQDPNTGQYSNIGYTQFDPQNYSNWNMPTAATTPSTTTAASSQSLLQGLQSSLTPNYQWNPYDENGNVQLYQPNLFPVSTSGSVSGSQGTSGSVSNSNSFSGLDEATRNAILSAVMPSLTQTAQGLSGVPGQYADNATNLYEQQARQSLEETMPQVMEAMGARNMMNSSVSENAQSEAMSSIADEFANKAYESQMTAGQMGMNVPQILGQLIGLGNYSQGGSQGASNAQNNSDSANYSISTDPSQAYTNYVNALSAISPYMIGTTSTGDISSMDSKAFYEWANQNKGSDAVAQWAREKGYTATQLAETYNAGGGLKPGDEGYITKEQAAQMLGL